MTVRPAAVAGLFYPGDPDECRDTVARLLADNPSQGPAPKALIVPHAGYIYSGPAAAAAYNLLAADKANIDRVVILGPNHRVPLQGIAGVSADVLATPLGDLPVDRENFARVEALAQVSTSDMAHAGEHSLEVHLPFLRHILGPVKVLPLLVGDCPPEQVAQVIEKLWDGEGTRFIISSDMSHFLSYDEARSCDRDTAQHILNGEAVIRPEQACGCRAINGLNQFLQTHPMAVDLLAMNNSGDTAGSRDRVVGYASFNIH